MPSDNLSHWSDVFMWRHHHYQAIVAAYESQAQHEPVSKHSLIFLLMHGYLPFLSVIKRLSSFLFSKYTLSSFLNASVISLLIINLHLSSLVVRYDLRLHSIDKNNNKTLKAYYLFTFNGSSSWQNLVTYFSYWYPFNLFPPLTVIVQLFWCSMFHLVILEAK